MSKRGAPSVPAVQVPELDEALRTQLRYLGDLGWREIYPPGSWREGGGAAEGSPAARSAGDQSTREPGAGTSSEPAVASPARRPGSGSTASQNPQASRQETPSVEAEPEADSESKAVAPNVAGCTDLVTLDALAQGCTACKLAERRKSVVFGSGPDRAELMVIGEGPGAREDEQGLPFVGPAGELLTRILGAIGQERSRVYIANVVKCRPPRNRDPQPGEVAACIGYLRRQIELVRPRVLVALGRVAAQALLESADPVGRMRGKWHVFQETPLRVTYHPAALLRNESLKRPTWEDMKVVRQRLEEMRSEQGAVE